MAKINLTDKEYEVMEILWQNNAPMLASDVMNYVVKTSEASVHHILNKLMDRGLVKVAGNIKVVKAQSRLYAPAVSPAEYIAMQSLEIFKTTTRKIDVKDYLMFLTKKAKNKNTEIVKEIKEFIDEYESEAEN